MQFTGLNAIVNRSKVMNKRGTADLTAAPLSEAALAASAHCPDWHSWFRQEVEQVYFKELEARVAQARARAVVYPQAQDVFNAFSQCRFDALKLVILGQDPYHQPGQAHGLSFSVPKGIKPPPSLRNIFKALDADLPGFSVPVHGDLSAWAQQGVLLLNTVLTVEESKAHSHAKIGWQHFTDNVMRQLNQHPRPLVFLLWGKHAQEKAVLIDASHHLKLQSVHPSPLSAHRGFFQCRHFSQANEFLNQHRQANVDWHAISNEAFVAHSDSESSATQKQQRQHKLAF